MLFSALKNFKNQKRLEFLGFVWYFDWLYPFKKTKNLFFCCFHFKKNRGNPKKHFLSQNQPFSEKFCFLLFWFCSSSLFFFGFVYWFTWLPSVSLCLLTLSVLGSQTLTNVSHSRACALCETKLGIGCAVMFMHLKVQILESWNLGFVHTHSCLCLTYSNKVYKYLETDTFGYFGGNGGVFLWEHVTLLCNRML